ncbi:MAG: DUF4012 domain-containing protein [Nitriliruptoraceae bacterium]|nr:DUF4012 domain-containing protein [Nitriliruptoraceae bacterium]
MADTDEPSPPGGGGAAGRRRRILLALGALLTLGLLLVTVDGSLAVRDLRTAQEQARSARTAIETGLLREALDATEEAGRAADAAHQRLSRAHWRAAETLPLVGADVMVVRALAATGGAAADLGEQVLDDVRPLVEQGAGGLVADGRLDLASLGDTADALERADLTELTAARRALEDVADRPRSPTLADAADQVLDVTGTVLTALPELGDTWSLMVDMLGGDGPRRYLVAVQNPGELRGTGGLIGFLVVLEFRDGEVTLAEPAGIDTDTAIDGTVLIPLGAFSRAERFDIQAPEDYQARYGSVGGATFLPSTNVDPDLPTVAPLVLAQYEQASGEGLDGLIALDPLALQLLFEAIGPLDVPDEIAGLSAALPDPIPAERLAEVLLIDSYEELGGGSADRRRYHAEVAGAALRTAMSGDWEPLDVARALADATSARHLQLHSTVRDEQRRLEAIGIAGALGPRHDEDDLIGLTVVNIGGNKADVHVGHQLRHVIDLEVVDTDQGPQLWRDTTSRLAIVNAVDPTSDPYISTSLEPTRPSEDRVTTGELGAVRSWVTLWGPTGGDLDRAQGLDGAELTTWRDRIHGLETVDHLLDTPNEDTTGVVFTVRGPTGTRIAGDSIAYPVTLWRQAKGVADHLDVVVTAPEGWTLRDVELAGDGPAIGLGPAPYTGPVEEIRRTPDTVELRGAMTADVRLVLHLERAG